MKASREPRPKPFIPVTIVLETEEEAARLWHRLNVPLATTFIDYCQEVGIDEERDLYQKMWVTLNRVYRPENVFQYHPGEEDC